LLLMLQLWTHIILFYACRHAIQKLLGCARLHSVPEDASYRSRRPPCLLWDSTMQECILPDLSSSPEASPFGVPTIDEQRYAHGDFLWRRQVLDLLPRTSCFSTFPLAQIPQPTLHCTARGRVPDLRHLLKVHRAHGWPLPPWELAPEGMSQWMSRDMEPECECGAQHTRYRFLDERPRRSPSGSLPPLVSSKNPIVTLPQVGTTVLSMEVVVSWKGTSVPSPVCMVSR
jgi:hypothetical protein